MNAQRNNYIKIRRTPRLDFSQSRLYCVKSYDGDLVGYAFNWDLCKGSIQWEVRWRDGLPVTVAWLTLVPEGQASEPLEDCDFISPEDCYVLEDQCDRFADVVYGKKHEMNLRTLKVQYDPMDNGVFFVKTRISKLKYLSRDGAVQLLTKLCAISRCCHEGNINTHVVKDNSRHPFPTYVWGGRNQKHDLDVNVYSQAASQPGTSEMK